MTDKPFGVDTLLPASVRRANYDDSDGPTPADLLPERQAFAEEFMRKEGIDPLESGSRQRGPDNDEPALFTKEFFEAQMEVIIQERVPVYASGLGNPGPWMSELRANGTKVMAVVGAVRHAIQVKSSGLDIIVAQGHDGGGHNSPVGTMALIPQVVDAVGDTPVLGAGGRGVAAALMLGAEGVWVGSAFGLGRSQYFRLPEAGHSRCNGRGHIGIAHRDGQTRADHSLQMDRALGAGDVEPLPMPYQGMISGPVMAAANRDGRRSGYWHEAVRPAKEIFDELVFGAEQALAGTTNLLR